MPYTLVIRDLCNFSNVLIFTFVSFVTKFKSWPRFKISICCNAFRPFSDIFRQINYIYNYKDIKGSGLKGYSLYVLSIIPVWYSGDQGNRASVAQVTVSKWILNLGQLLNLVTNETKVKIRTLEKLHKSLTTNAYGIIFNRTYIYIVNPQPASVQCTLIGALNSVPSRNDQCLRWHPLYHVHCSVPFSTLPSTSYSIICLGTIKKPVAHCSNQDV